MRWDVFNVIAFLKKRDYLKMIDDGYVLTDVPSLSDIAEEVERMSGDECTVRSLISLLSYSGIKRNDASCRT
jgi:hypothetical protein